VVQDCGWLGFWLIINHALFILQLPPVKDDGSPPMTVPDTLLQQSSRGPARSDTETAGEHWRSHLQCQLLQTVVSTMLQQHDWITIHSQQT
jgi:hypothetical protein